MAENDGNVEKLLFGKYKTIEEAERGFRNLVSEADKWKAVAATGQEQLKLMKEVNETLKASSVTNAVAGREAPALRLTNDDGNIDANAIEQLLDAKQKPLIDAMRQIPKLIQEEVRGFLAPIQGSLKAKQDFFAREDVSAKFTDAELQKVLQRNPGINSAFELMLGNPETQGKAYEVAYDLWRATSGAASEGNNSRRAAAKRDAAEPVAQGGPPLATGTEPNAEALAKLAEHSQNIMGPDSELAFAREWIKGTAIEKDIEKLRPDWADTREEAGI